jgi:hypothetical protein
MMMDFNDAAPHAFGGIEALEARAEVLMQEAIEMMIGIADALTEPDEPPIPVEQRRKACLDLCAKVFDRLQGEETTMEK